MLQNPRTRHGVFMVAQIWKQVEIKQCSLSGSWVSCPVYRPAGGHCPGSVPCLDPGFTWREIRIGVLRNEKFPEALTHAISGVVTCVRSYSLTHLWYLTHPELITATASLNILTSFDLVRMNKIGACIEPVFLSQRISPACMSSGSHFGFLKLGRHVQ
jgi:hypothetical protein